MLTDCSSLLNNLHIEPLSSSDYDEIIVVWENSVRATHHFLTEKEIAFYKPLVLKYALPSMQVWGVRIQNKLAGFTAVSSHKTEMLFIAPEERGHGLGRQLLHYGIENYGVERLAVNEQNPQAKGFYEHMGFQVYKRTDCDEQGNPYPLLYMNLIQKPLKNFSDGESR